MIMKYTNGKGKLKQCRPVRKGDIVVSFTVQDDDETEKLVNYVLSHTGQKGNYNMAGLPMKHRHMMPILNVNKEVV